MLDLLPDENPVRLAAVSKSHSLVFDFDRSSELGVTLVTKQTVVFS